MATYRQIHVKIWSSPDFQSLSYISKLIFIHLFSNSHRNEAALYRITTKTISNETDIPTPEVDQSITELEEAALIKYDRDNFIVWAINAVKYQKTSPNEVTAIAKNLLNTNHPYCQEFINYYKGTLSTLEGTIEVLINTPQGTPGKGKGKGKGSIKKEKDITPPKNPKPEKIKYAELVSLTEVEHERLVKEFGDPFVKRCIEVLDNHKGANNKKYVDDNRAIRLWVVDKVKKDTETPKPRSPSPYPTEIL